MPEYYNDRTIPTARCPACLTDFPADIPHTQRYDCANCGSRCNRFLKGVPDLARAAVLAWQLAYPFSVFLIRKVHGQRPYSVQLIQGGRNVTTYIANLDQSLIEYIARWNQNPSLSMPYDEWVKAGRKSLRYSKTVKVDLSDGEVAYEFEVEDE